jgi:hypothetical protein
MPTASDARQHSPAAERNRAPILDALRRLLPATGTLLEIASGSGQHAVHCAAGLPGWRWQPSDRDAAALASIEAWRARAALPNLLAPIALDVMARPWPLGTVDAIFCANLLHIAPWAVCAALMDGAARHLAGGGLLLTYGPYLEAGVPTAPSNLAFDADLRGRDRAWGLRRLEDVAETAAQAGLTLGQRLPMPANNLLLVFRRKESAAAPTNDIAANEDPT